MLTGMGMHDIGVAMTATLHSPQPYKDCEQSAVLLAWKGLHTQHMPIYVVNASIGSAMHVNLPQLFSLNRHSTEQTKS